MNDEKRGIEEIYTSAMNSSDLRVEADRTGDADVIIVAGWTQARIGGAMLRLHTEYDSTEKPRMAEVEYFYEPMLRTAEANGRKLTKEERKNLKRRAHEKKHEFNIQQLSLFLERLKALPDVRQQAAVQMMKWGMGQSQDPITRSERTEVREHDAEMLKRLREVVATAPAESAALEAANADLVAAVAEVDERRRAEGQEDFDRCSEKASSIVRWWLHQICPVCGGTKLQVAEGTNRHNGKACGGCEGTGKSEIPHQHEGRRVANWMDQCIERYRASLGQRVYGRQIVEDARAGVVQAPFESVPRIRLRPPRAPAMTEENGDHEDF
ncbi:hypothetical protein [Variovorax boronicumulans]|uniref:hypothetical protein n=1 Tax=Variovorax boronicumulans TaxID=436515 RepID=UPI0027D789AC|nr:hypothetical protein [Variovorax boronicumulans]